MYLGRQCERTGRSTIGPAIAARKLGTHRFDHEERVALGRSKERFGHASIQLAFGNAFGQRRGFRGVERDQGKLNQQVEPAQFEQEIGCGVATRTTRHGEAL